MVDAEVYNIKLFALLRALPDIGERVYDGTVPDILPMDGKYIRPYVVVFTGLGSDLPEERDASGKYDTDILDWRPQVTVVGPSPSACRGAAQQVSSALTNVRMGAGLLHPDAESFRISKPLIDSQVTPARAYLPLNWRLLTT